MDRLKGQYVILPTLNHLLTLSLFFYSNLSMKPDPRPFQVHKLEKRLVKDKAELLALDP